MICGKTPYLLWENVQDLNSSKMSGVMLWHSKKFYRQKNVVLVTEYFLV